MRHQFDSVRGNPGSRQIIIAGLPRTEIRLDEQVRHMLDPSDIDYQGLGFKAGLEIHHQLKAKRKLFCYCPAELDVDLQKRPEFVFHRRFRAVRGDRPDL